MLDGEEKKLPQHLLHVRNHNSFVMSPLVAIVIGEDAFKRDQVSVFNGGDQALLGASDLPLRL